MDCMDTCPGLPNPEQFDADGDGAGAACDCDDADPNRYPLAHDVERYIAQEQRLGRMLDYAVIVPRLQRLYDWSATELGEPRLLDGQLHERLVRHACHPITGYRLGIRDSGLGIRD